MSLLRASDLLNSKLDVDQKASCRFIVDVACILQLQRQRLLLPLRRCLRLSFSRVAAVVDFASSQFVRLFVDPRTLQVQQQLLREQRHLAQELRKQQILQQQSPPQQQQQQDAHKQEEGEEDDEQQQQQQQQLLHSAGSGSPYRLSAIRLLHLIEGGDLRDLASLEKIFQHLLDREDTSRILHLRKLLQALFVLALQPSKYLESLRDWGDACMRDRRQHDRRQRETLRIFEGPFDASCCNCLSLSLSSLSLSFASSFVSLFRYLRALTRGMKGPHWGFDYSSIEAQRTFSPSTVVDGV